MVDHLNGLTSPGTNHRTMIDTKSLPPGAINGSQAVSGPRPDRVVSRPTPSSQANDPRKYQVTQIKKRFSALESTLQNGTTNLQFQLRPSDPDFPYELDSLQCELQVPASYPDHLPSLSIKNKDIPRGFSVNIERGWEKLVNEKKGSTLLALTNALDKNLEAFLSEQKADTVTLVSFKDTRHLQENAATTVGQVLPPSQERAQPQTVPEPAPVRPYIPEKTFTKDEITAAKAKRAQEIRQLEARMGRTALFQRSADGVVYTLPFEPKRRTALPTGLQTVQSVQLIIPVLYPLQPLRILLNEVDSDDAEALEEAFATKAAQQTQMPLMSHVNYLSQNMHILAKQAQEAKKQVEEQAKVAAQKKLEESAAKEDPERNSENHQSIERSHVQFIPRPPEWVVVGGSEDSADSDEFSFSEDESDEDGGVLVERKPTSGAAPQLEQGTLMSFPAIELHSIELLQVSILSISVKCDRCKTVNEMGSLRPDVEKASSCKKCATAFTAKFRPEMVHQHSVRAGFIDVSGCKVADMLPSTFVPTCAKCSTPSHGLVSVRGEATTNVCRECHGKFTFKIPEVKFIAITQGSTLPPSAGPKRKQEKLGLHAGEPLPEKGACQHYKKSYRWFRFSCCNKVYPCDRCHEEAEDHINEWANRMICGWCSREQNYAVDACGFCGRSVIRKRGKGFWEGGKGTRDRTLMSRKDKRKYRNRT